ncbi:Ribonuclease/ribotoxin [Macrophomina phaseolina MS6]|uniref:Ribonuclease/ribotoxin n=1 Tax=Macrophomina phaseolina (strain MS6) TaxID=1126212 RepID=K2S1Z3_MACPH|nr:Ribonuclease/ribotoxin [Macrophomina phaseolina MS6]
MIIFFIPLVILPLYFRFTSAQPHNLHIVHSRNGAINCSGAWYTASDVLDCERTACNHVYQSTTARTGRYPSKYHNYEGFIFHNLTSDSLWEFPLRPGGTYTYTGGKPPSFKSFEGFHV